MTLLPADAFKIEPQRGEEFPPYKVPPICALQGCSRINVEAHHIARRSWTIGPYDWLKIDGVLVGNKIPLCHEHHRLVTEGRSRIVWEEESGQFFWLGIEGTLTLTQPPTLTQIKEDPDRQMPVGNTNECPTCHRVIPDKHAHLNGHEAKRPRKTWTITVPSDAREVGADVLDTLLESARLILDDRGLSYGPDRGVRYFVLSTSLGLFVAHAEEILS